MLPQLNQCSKARTDPDMLAELLGMLLKFEADENQIFTAYDSRGLSHHNFAN